MTPFLRDSAERVASAFLLALASTLLLAGTDVLSLSTWHAAAVAGVTAALVAVKSLVAARIGGTISPASLAPGARNLRVNLTKRAAADYVTHVIPQRVAARNSKQED